MKWNGQNLKLLLTSIGAVLGAFAAVYAINAYLESIVDNKIYHPDFINKVAEKTRRPVVIFDQSDSILLDNGGMAYIEKIHVSAKGKTPRQIVVSPNRHLNIAPILESLDEQFVIREHRGEKFDWIYDLGERQVLVIESSAKPKETIRFRLEIIP